MKANPGKYTFASAGNGTSQHLSGELFKSMAGVDMQHIPYKGSPPALQDVVGGQVTMTFDNITTAWPLAKAGKLRALAVTTAKRSAVAPDVPTLAESGLAGFEVGSWQGVFAPAGTPPEIVKRLNAEIVKILNMPDVKEKTARRSAPSPSAIHLGAIYGVRQDRSREVVRRREEIGRESRLMGVHRYSAVFGALGSWLASLAGAVAAAADVYPRVRYASSRRARRAMRRTSSRVCSPSG